MARKSISKVGQAIAKAADRRIDILGIGDSNQLYNAFGWDHGFQYALSNKFDMYATGMITAKEVGLGGGVGYGYNFADNDGGVAQNGAPASSVAESYMDGNLTPQAHGYLASGSITQGLGLLASRPADFPADPLDILNSVVKCHFCYGTFDTGAGEFNAGVRLEASPWTTYDSATISTNTGVEGIAFTELDVTTTPRPDRIESRFAHASQTLTGPFVGYYQRMEIPVRTAGYSYTTMYGLGGASAYDMASAFQAAHDNTIWLNLNEARRLQESAGQEPIVIVMISTGLNDRNETSQPSLGPNPSTDPDSADAYVDNITAIINRVQSVWNANFTDGELHFLIIPSHPITPEDSELVAYRAAIKTYADTVDNVEVLDMTEYVSGADFDAWGWYDGGGDEHLTQKGYEGAATLMRKNYFVKRKPV